MHSQNNSLSFKDCDAKLSDEEIHEEKISQPLIPHKGDLVSDKKLLKSVLTDNGGISEPLGIDIISGSVRSSDKKASSGNNTNNQTGATILKGTVLS